MTKSADPGETVRAGAPRRESYAASAIGAVTAFSAVSSPSRARASALAASPARRLDLEMSA